MLATVIRKAYSTAIIVHIFITWNMFCAFAVGTEPIPLKPNTDLKPQQVPSSQAAVRLQQQIAKLQAQLDSIQSSKSQLAQEQTAAENLGMESVGNVQPQMQQSETQYNNRFGKRMLGPQPLKRGVQDLGNEPFRKRMVGFQPMKRDRQSLVGWQPTKRYLRPQRRMVGFQPMKRGADGSRPIGYEPIYAEDLDELYEPVYQDQEWARVPLRKIPVDSGRLLPQRSADGVPSVGWQPTRRELSQLYDSGHSSRQQAPYYNEPEDIEQSVLNTIENHLKADLSRIERQFGVSPEAILKDLRWKHSVKQKNRPLAN
jgi:hypothetical protein